MFSIKKDDADRLLEDFLVNVAKINGSKTCADETVNLIRDQSDSQFLTALIVMNSMKKELGIPHKFIDFEARISSALATMFSVCDKEDIPIELKDLFVGDDEQIIDNFNKSHKLNFALQQFVGSYFAYDLFESKYPQITKFL